MNGRLSLILGLAVTTALAAGVHADGPATTGPATLPTTAPAAAIPARLQAALDDLSSDDPHVRLAAQNLCVGYGTEAEPALRALISTTADLEQRNGASAALARIGEAASIGATIINLHVKNVTPKELIAAFNKVAKTKITLQNGDNGEQPRISICIDHEPFWRALLNVCAAAELNLEPDYGNSDLVVTANQSDDFSHRPYLISGPFMVMANSITMNSNVQLTQPISTSKVESMDFICFSEPKLKISQRPYNMKLTEAADNTGGSLLTSGDNGEYEGDSSDARSVWHMNASLALPGPGAKKINRLRGHLQVMAATRVQTIEINDILRAKNVTRSAGPNSLTVKDVTNDDDSTKVNIILTVPPNRNNIGFQLAQTIQLIDTDGNATTNNGVDGGGSFTRLEYRMTFDRRQNGDKKPGTPAKLVLSVPMETRAIGCDWEFKDLPLP